MGGRALKVLVTLWWVAWGCVIVPAHTRGAVGVDGEVAKGADGRRVSFFLSSLPACCQSKQVPGKKGSPAGSAGNCAICMIVANTGVTPDVPMVVEGLREAAFGFLGREGQVASGEFVAVYLGRGPPA